MDLLYQYWGKAQLKNVLVNGISYHPLVLHSLDVVATGRAWLKYSPALSQKMTVSLGMTQETGQAWIDFFLFLHDLGKGDIRFQYKVEKLASQLFPDAFKPRLISGYNHGAAGYMWFEEYRNTEFQDYGTQWIEAVCSHHGSCERVDRILKNQFASPIDINRDRNFREKLISTGIELFLEPIGIKEISPPVDPSNLLAGFCSICDWVASNETWFAYCQKKVNLVRYLDDRMEIGLKALKECGLCHLGYGAVGMNELYPDYIPRGVQEVIDTLLVKDPGITIIEAPTGSGKTEAALALASHHLSNEVADSILFALPTQATANAMFQRLEEIAPKLFPGRSNIVLAHGKSRFNPGLQNLIEISEYKTLDDEASVQCSQWLAQSRKRAFLGQIGVCTIDQVLLSVLPVKHHFVRRFGVGRSVLIIDEIHAYDSYMNGLLDHVLRAQKEAAGSVILLSATLTQERKREILSLWGIEDKVLYEDYPLVTHITDARVDEIVPKEISEEKIVKANLKFCENAIPDEVFCRDLICRAKNGQVISVICNLVSDAQVITKKLLDFKSDVQIDLFHARFAFKDRTAIESRILKEYGKDRKIGQGKILVATQVVEQSLDLDFDYMVTQLCPVDLLFQRIGRLHRHTKLHKTSTQAVCTVLSFPGNDFGLHQIVYKSPSLLWRTRELLIQNIEIIFPNAYRSWIERVYSSEPMENEPPEISSLYDEWKNTEEGSRFAANTIAVASIEFPDTDSSAARLTRDGEMSTSILPYVNETGCLINGIDLGPIKDTLHQEEIASLEMIPAPASWAKWFRKEEICNGFYLLPVELEENGWKAESGNSYFKYDAHLGLERRKNESS